MSKIQMINTQQRRSQLFTADGTFTAPVGVTTVFLTGCAGGGGGGGAASALNLGRGGGGGGGESCLKQDVTTVPLTTYTVTVGTAGASGPVDTDAGAGGITSFDVLLSLSGGGGGKKGVLNVHGAGGAAGGSTQTAVQGRAKFPGSSILFAYDPFTTTPAGIDGMDGNGGWGGSIGDAIFYGGAGGPGYLLVEWVGV